MEQFYTEFLAVENSLTLTTIIQSTELNIFYTECRKCLSSPFLLISAHGYATWLFFMQFKSQYLTLSEWLI
jgi:hypothetical protein